MLRCVSSLEVSGFFFINFDGPHEHLSPFLSLSLSHPLHLSLSLSLPLPLSLSHSLSLSLSLSLSFSLSLSLVDVEGLLYQVTSVNAWGHFLARGWLRYQPR